MIGYILAATSGDVTKAGKAIGLGSGQISFVTGGSVDEGTLSTMKNLTGGASAPVTGLSGAVEGSGH